MFRFVLLILPVALLTVPLYPRRESHAAIHLQPAPCAGHALARVAHAAEHAAHLRLILPVPAEAALAARSAPR